jgi:isopentenyl-diphosphate delta-isomerase
VHEESVVLVDEEGCYAGTTGKATVHTENTPLHLAFSCYVFNSEGQLLLTQRALGKRTWPGVWTNSCCGHPAPDEPVPLAVIRRLRQELDLVVEHVDLILPRFRYRATMDNGVVENELCPVFRAVTDDEPVADESEVTGIAWIDWTDFSRDVLARRREVSPWCRLQTEQLDALGESPGSWPVADMHGLPPAAREFAGA